MFCKKPLGANEVVEAFPIGRRLAFDAAKGRLWVVCRRCERWNLTPLEERWEAVETCEKLFRGTRIRTSSENIGLARHPEGLELVRIGKPLRPEFAAWRYGDQFGRRRRRTILNWTAASLGLAGGVAWAGAAGGFVAATFAFQGVNYANLWNSFRPKVYFRPEDGRLRWLKPSRYLRHPDPSFRGRDSVPRAGTGPAVPVRQEGSRGDRRDRGQSPAAGGNRRVRGSSPGP